MFLSLSLISVVGSLILTAMGILFHFLDNMPPHEMQTPMETSDTRTGWNRFLAFIEQPFFLVVLGIIGGIVGVLVYTPIFLVCDACVLLALHRSKAVADKRPLVQWFWYCVVFIVMSSILVVVGIVLRNSARRFVRDLAKAVVEGTTPTVGQLPPAPPQVQQQAQPENPPTPQAPKEISLNPFDLTGRRGETFSALLGTQLATRDTIRVGCIGWIEESCIAAGKFLLLFSQAGWKIDSNRVFRFDPSIPSEGMTIAAKTPKYTDNLPPHLGHWGAMDASQVTFWQTFSWMQIPVGASGDPDMPVGTIGVYFGSEPKNVNVRTIAQTQKQLAQVMGLILIELRAVERTCSTQADTCKTNRLQWTQVVSAFLDYCDCGLNKSWSKKWKDVSNDIEGDPLTIINRQDKALQRFIITLNKEKH